MNRPATFALPLVVSFREALMATRWHQEILAEAILRRPRVLLTSMWTALRDRVSMGAVLARAIVPDIGVLPLRRDLIAWLRSQRARGREIFLYNDTGRELTVPDEMSALVSGVISPEAGEFPRASACGRLEDQFPSGFTYVGRAAGASSVGKLGAKVVLLGSRGELDRAAKRLGKDVEAAFPEAGPSWHDWLRLLRPHHWTKNLLLFVPFLLEQSWRTPGILLNGLLGFIVLAIIASSTYVLNDLADLEADRRHWSKRMRPLASGVIPLPQAALVAVIGIAGALSLAASLSTAFCGFLLAYLVLTIGYSLGLKRIALLDVAIIAVLFALRLTMGISLSGAAYSEWLLTFALMLFLSLALAKRHGEVLGAAKVDSHGLGHRGYLVSDAPLTLAIGTATAVASLVIMMIYLVDDEFPQGRYAVPEWLWVVPAVLSLWLGRIWLLVHRQKMHDDPIAFALRDPPSLLMGSMVALAFALAV